MWSGILSNMITYSHDITIYATVLIAQDFQCVADLLSRDLVGILVRYNQWGMKLNLSKSRNLFAIHLKAIFHLIHKSLLMILLFLTIWLKCYWIFLPVSCLFLNFTCNRLHLWSHNRWVCWESLARSIHAKVLSKINCIHSYICVMHIVVLFCFLHPKVTWNF